MRTPKVYWRSLRREWNRNGWEPTDTGWLLSLAITITVLRIGLLEDNIGAGSVSKFDQFLKLKPSEMGDTLAGLFSALAFIWIIVTVFIQSKELRLQRNEISEQREATQKMANAQAEQVRLLGLQSKILTAQHDQAVKELAAQNGKAIYLVVKDRLVPILTNIVQVSIDGASPQSLKVIDHLKRKPKNGREILKLSITELTRDILVGIERIYAPDQYQGRLSSPEIDGLRVPLRGLIEIMRDAEIKDQVEMEVSALKIFEEHISILFWGPK